MRLALLVILLCSAVLQAFAAWTEEDEHAVPTGQREVRVVNTTVANGDRVRLHAVWPDPERSRLIVLDNPGNALRLDQAMADRGCLAGVNGGYFHADTTPLGLVMSEGRRLHPLQRARLLSGVLSVRGGRPEILRAGELPRSTPPSDALQAGPLLIDRGRPVQGLDATRSARRTLVMTDRSGRYGLAVTDSALTLADLAAILATPGIIHTAPLTRALNLDGGSSSGLWVGGGLYLPEGKRVRNFLCVLAVD